MTKVKPGLGFSVIASDWEQNAQVCRHRKLVVQTLASCGTETPVGWAGMPPEREQAGETGKRVTLLTDMKFALFLLISSITWGNILSFS